MPRWRNATDFFDWLLLSRSQYARLQEIIEEKEARDQRILRKQVDYEWRKAYAASYATGEVWTDRITDRFFELLPDGTKRYLPEPPNSEPPSRSH